MLFLISSEKVVCAITTCHLGDIRFAISYATILTLSENQKRKKERKKREEQVTLVVVGLRSLAGFFFC